MRLRFGAPVLALLFAIVGLALPGPAAASSLGLKATYDVTAHLGYAAGTLSVRSTASVTNGTPDGVDALVFNLLPVKIGSIVIREVLVDGQPATYSAAGQTLTVNLPATLAPEAGAAVIVDYGAKFRTTSTDKNWMFAKLNGIVTAYRWIPWLSRAVKFARPNFGDPFVTGVSPEVRVSLSSDRQLVYATTGRQTSANGMTRTFVAEKVRDFNFSASPSYKLYKGKAGGIPIRVYYVNMPGSTMFTWAKRALNRFSQQVGKYPYPRFVVAETIAGTGMESPGMIWIPRSTKSANLAYLVVHEAAHQWFYAVVGNDQAAEPYADEAPAEFLTRSLLSSRRGSKCATSTLDGTVYDYGSSCYYEVVYIQGGNYLDDYRLRMGDEAFWAGLRAYYDAYRFRIGGTRQLLEHLDAAAGEGLMANHEARFPRVFKAV